jgi:hypothetical protein
MTRLTICVMLTALIGFPGMSATGAQPGGNDAGQTAKTLRVGTFDSRAIALAYYRKFLRSPEFVASLKKLTAERDQAKAAGDHEKAKKLEAEGRAGQEQVHSQVFGSAPVDELVAKIKDQLPEIAKRAEVDLILSKWNIAYRAPSAEFVDVTEPMATLFQPDQETWKIIREQMKHAPLSREELRKHEHDKNF